MESMVEREAEEVLGVDLVARRSKHRTHYTDFVGTTPDATGGGMYESKSTGGRIENESRSVVEEEEGEDIYESKSNGGRVENDSRSVVEEEAKVEGEDEEEVQVEEAEDVDGVESKGSLLGRNTEGIFLGENGGSESPSDLSRVEQQVVSYFLPMKNNSDFTVENASVPKSYQETNHKYLEISRDESPNTFSTLTAKTSNEDHGIAVNGCINRTAKPGESSVAEETKIIPEFDVEKVIEKQETHDLYCPNCNSCITKRVILRRRKRKIEEISGGAERDSSELVQNDSPPVRGSILDSLDDGVLPDHVNDTAPDVFRCLSCFSIFIPIGKGFKFFTFGGRGSKLTIKDVPKTSASDTPAAVPTVTDNVEIETRQEEHLGVDSVQEESPLKSQSELLPEQGGEPSWLPSGEQETSIPIAHDGDTKPELPKVDIMALPTEQPKEADVRNELPEVNNITGPAFAEKEVTEGQLEGLQILIHTSEVPAVPSTLIPHIGVPEIKNKDTGKHVVVPVTEESDPTVVSLTPAYTSPETEPLLQPGTNTDAVTAAAPAAPTAGGVSQLDIMKSIVYGGLVESIASLSVVTSAAGSNTKTLNVLALGAANMFGGLFVLAHNLRVLKHETSDERYEEVLGRPGHFVLHATVAVISYLVFGLIPPVIYGFTFRESDNRDYKLLTVASASLVCTIILALGKVYTRRPPKSYTKTVSYYVSLWVMACGVSYAAGDLLDLLLQKLGLFGSSSSVAMTVGEALKTSWASY